MPVESGGSTSTPLPSNASTASNQTLTLNTLDIIYDALVLVGQETTNVQIRDAVLGLGEDASLADLAAAFSADAVVQADILAALEASEIDIAATRAGIDLLVPDLDAVRVATEATSVAIALLLARSVPGSAGPTPLSPKTVPTVTAEAVASSTAATRYVRVTSDFANTKTVYVSGVGVTVANGQPLGPGDVYTCTDVNNANLLYCISADAAQILRVEVL